MIDSGSWALPKLKQHHTGLGDQEGIHKLIIKLHKVCLLLIVVN